MTLRVGILGPGGIAARHARAISQMPERLHLVASCGRDAERTSAFSHRFGGTAFTDFPSMLDEAALDLLVVTLPPGAHGGEVKAAAARGINLLVEKPIALDLQHAQTMVTACHGIVAACGFMYRFGAATRRWDELCAAGMTGLAGHFSGSFHCNALHAPWWRERALGGGQMVEQLIHIVDLARHTLGMPQSVYARAANLYHGDIPRYDSEDVSGMILGYDDGRMAVLHASNAAVPGRWTKQWQIIAERMTGIFLDFNTAEIVTTSGEVASENISGSIDPFVAQLVDVADAIEQKRAPLVPLLDGLESLRIVLAARQSADVGQEIRL